MYLRGVSTGDMGEALSVLVGEEAKGLNRLRTIASPSAKSVIDAAITSEFL
jgi:hypothetical protein